MNLKINSIRPASDDEWDAVWEDCEYATYFHSREWADIWNVYSNGNISTFPQFITFSDGRECLLPISIQRRFLGFLMVGLSSPAGTFGGWISKDKLLAEHVELMANYVTKRFRAVNWRVNPYDPNMPLSIDKSARDDCTYSLDLNLGFDAISGDWSKGRGSMARKIRKAAKAGVSVRFANKLEDWQSYYQVYEQSLRRWGDEASSSYKWALFNDLFQRHSQDIALWAAVRDGKIICGAICFYSKKHVVYWHGAALQEHFNLRPVNLLMSEIIRNACEREYRWFDFNPSGGHEGVTSFKKSFGAKPLPSPSVVVLPRLTKTVMKAQGKANGALKKIKKFYSSDSDEVRNP